MCVAGIDADAVSMVLAIGACVRSNRYVTACMLQNKTTYTHNPVSSPYHYRERGGEETSRGWSSSILFAVPGVQWREWLPSMCPAEGANRLLWWSLCDNAATATGDATTQLLLFGEACSLDEA